MLCPFCNNKTDIPIKKRYITEHLVVTRDQKYHYHVHGPISDKKEILEMVKFICKEAGIETETED